MKCEYCGADVRDHVRMCNECFSSNGSLICSIQEEAGE